MSTLDGLALELLLKGDQKGLKKLAKAVKNGPSCPECGACGPHDDNGATRASELSYCCQACGSHFDAI